MDRPYTVLYYELPNHPSFYAAAIHDTPMFSLALNHDYTHHHPNHHHSHPSYRFYTHPPGRGITRSVTHVTPPPIIPYCDTTNRALIHTYHRHIHHLVRTAIRQTQVLRCTGLKK